MLKKLGILLMYLFFLVPSSILIYGLGDAIVNDRVTVFGETRTERHERIYGHSDLSDWSRHD
jgi:hypothetical protein